MKILELEAIDFKGPSQWRWRLSGPGGGFLADHEVELDWKAGEYDAFWNLDSHLRWFAAPDRRLASEADLLRRVGIWIGAEVLGSVGVAIAKSKPAIVRLRLPPNGGILGYVPLDLGYVDDRPLALQNVSFVCQSEANEPASDGAGDDRLRMLAIFSLPVDTSALALRHERYTLTRLIHRIAATNHRSIELRVLQYGVTRDRLADVLLEADGWDVIHVSGHGLPAGLLLELDDGRRDLISTEDLVTFLDPTEHRLKLVMLSSCESAALTASESLRLLGLRPDERPLEAGEEAQPLPALASRVADQLGCAVMAMRYPVVDDFAIALASHLYDMLLGKGQPLPRALQLALPRALGPEATPGVPPLSVATPALFGSAAVSLRLQPPRGEPLVFDATQLKLARFPGEPEHFVGRGASMARANQVLAPASRQTVVLFHGMAGAGKTSCALELAYGHEQTFDLLVWHKCPDDGHDIATALTALAVTFKRDLGVDMLHLVDDDGALRDFLPQLTEYLERANVLIVLDNLESLLTNSGEWRDARWADLLPALSDHTGLSRVIATSRRRPTECGELVHVETIHALSLKESVLLARQLENLGALLDGRADVDVDRGRALVARALAVVQGHPGLLRLANAEASNPAALERRLEAAGGAWAADRHELEAFLDEGKSKANADDYVRVLGAWTRGAIASLGEDAALLFGVLCCIEEVDRTEYVLEGNWSDIWTRLNHEGDAPHRGHAIAQLLDQGLVDREPAAGGDWTYRVHPGVAAEGRAAVDETKRAAVDYEVAAYWATLFAQALERESEHQLGSVVRLSAQRALPYLLRLGELTDADQLLSSLIARDRSPSTAAAVLPLAQELADRAKGTAMEPFASRTLAEVQWNLGSRSGEGETRSALLAAALAREDFSMASTLATDLCNKLRHLGRLDEALDLAGRAAEYTRRAGFGPWTQAVDRAVYLQLLTLMGRDEQALEEVRELAETVDALPMQSDAEELVEPWNVREVVYSVGRDAASNLERWEESIAFNARVLESKEARHASPIDLARAAMNDCEALTALGRRDDARQLLLWCREVAEGANDVMLLGRILGALAAVEATLGHGETSLQLAEDALRIGYATGDTHAAVTGHHNVALYLAEAGRHRAAVSHATAAAALALHAGIASKATTFLALAHPTDDSPPYSSIEAVAADLGQEYGVKFRELFERLLGRFADGTTALAEVWRAVAARRGEGVATWEPMIILIARAATGDEEARGVADATLAELIAQPETQDLATVLRRILAGEREGGLADGLDGIDRAVVHRMLAAVDGETQRE